MVPYEVKAPAILPAPWHQGVIIAGREHDRPQIGLNRGVAPDDRQLGELETEKGKSNGPGEEDAPSIAPSEAERLEGAAGAEPCPDTDRAQAPEKRGRERPMAKRASCRAFPGAVAAADVSHQAA